jgi:tRNA/tmRNA/rRNA uracil-C5-methylase (TrmA/RlmC/RlmD family)
MPEGVMDAKVEEFRNISQGTQKIQEYATYFSCMMRYAPNETNTEKKKMYFFKKGLNSHLKVALLGHTCHTLHEMINKVLDMERDRLEADALDKEKKRRAKGSSYTQLPKGHVHLCHLNLVLTLSRELHLLQAMEVVPTPLTTTAQLRVTLPRARACGRPLRPPP